MQLVEESTTRWGNTEVCNGGGDQRRGRTADVVEIAFGETTNGLTIGRERDSLNTKIVFRKARFVAISAGF
jgi:hypothetical protein